MPGSRRTGTQLQNTRARGREGGREGGEGRRPVSSAQRTEEALGFLLGTGTGTNTADGVAEEGEWGTWRRRVLCSPAVPPAVRLPRLLHQECQLIDPPPASALPPPTPLFPSRNPHSPHMYMCIHTRVHALIKRYLCVCAYT